MIAVNGDDIIQKFSFFFCLVEEDIFVVSHGKEYTPHRGLCLSFSLFLSISACVSETSKCEPKPSSMSRDKYVWKETIYPKT